MVFAMLLQSMAGLEDMRSIRHLCLYSNDLTKIDYLDQLTELELLWLNDNRISVIEVFYQPSFLAISFIIQNACSALTLLVGQEHPACIN